jgi:PKD repeat protein/outer membrane protein assembly factor BamB/pimeloyl-ACP methyl ester carboxylesterase
MVVPVAANEVPSIEWQKSLGGSGKDYAESIQQTNDGGYIVAGYSGSNDGDVIGNHGNFDYWIVKLDASGNIIWQKSLGGLGFEVARGSPGDDEAQSIQQTSDGGYIVAGFSHSNDGDVTNNKGGKDYWIVKLDSSGNITWQKSLGGSGGDSARSIQQTNDGGYIVAGNTQSNDGDVTGNHGHCDYWIVKLDASGNITWQKSLGGSDYDSAMSIQQTNDGGYIIAGDSISNDGDVTGNHGYDDYWIVKLDASGNITWQKSLGGSDLDNANSIQQTDDGGYIVAGSTQSNDGDVTGHHGRFDFWIVKLDASGNITWQKCLGGSGDNCAHSIQQTDDGGYIAAGLGNLDYWVVKLDANGNITWQKFLGGSGHDRVRSIQQTGDGGYIVAGWCTSNDGDVTGNHGYDDYWIVKLTNAGNVVATISSLTPSTITAGSDEFTLEVTGTNFGEGAKVLWAGQERTTVFVSTTKLTTTILHADVANVGTYEVTVVNPDGKESGEFEFNVIVPSVSSVWKYRSDLNNSGVYDDGGTRPEALELWKFQTGGQVYSSPVVANGFVYFGGNDNKIYALNADTGTQIWNFTTSGASWSSPAVANGVVYYGGLSKFYALNATNGALLWDFSSGQVESSPAVANGVVYFGSRDYKVYALNADNGNLIWSFSTGSYVQSSPAVADGVVYIASYDGRVYALNAVTGTKIWEFDTGDPIQSSPAVVNGIVYIGSWNGKVHAINADSGSEVWNFSTLAQIDTSPAVADGVVYFGSRDHKIYSLSAETGTEIWTFNTGNEVISSPSFANGVVYIAAIGRLYALNADTGIQIWNFSCGGGTTSSPAIANGLIYVGSQDTCLYAIGKISYSNPTIVTISPSSITAGSDAFTLEVTGTNFVDGAKVLWEGQERATVFISTTKLTTTILQGDVANAGTYSVTVVNPNGVESGELHFEVTPSSSGELLPPPTLLEPGDPSSPGPIIDTLAPQFNWTLVPDADEYGLYIRNLNSDTIIFDSRLAGYTITGNTCTLPSGILQPDTQYRWNMNSHSSAGWNDDLVSGYSQKFYFTTPSGTQPQASPVIAANLTLSPGPYKVGDTISATYTIRNDGSAAITFSNLTVGGRHDLSSGGDGTLPDGTLPDFTHRSIILQPGESYNYQGELTLRYGGEYHFFCAYSPYSGDPSGWNSNVPIASPRIRHEVDIDVKIPVILIHGWNGSPDTWNELHSRLVAEGYPVLILDYEDYNTADPRLVANTLDLKIKEYKAGNDYDGKFDIVCHSMGALVSRWYIEQLDGEENIREWIGIAPANHGCALADLPLGPFRLIFLGAAGEQLMTDSVTVTTLSQDVTESPINYHVIVGINKNRDPSIYENVKILALTINGETRTRYCEGSDCSDYYGYTYLGDGILSTIQSQLTGSTTNYFDGLDHEKITHAPGVIGLVVYYLANPNSEPSLPTDLPELKFNSLDLLPGDILICRPDQSFVPGFWTHCGIYIGHGNIVEAVGEPNLINSLFPGKVMVTPVSDWMYPKKTYVEVLRLKNDQDNVIGQHAAQFALDQVNKEYDWKFFSPEVYGPLYYCSELVWAAYFDASDGTINLNSNIFTADKGAISPTDIENSEFLTIIGEHKESLPGTIGPEWGTSECPIFMTVIDSNGAILNRTISEIEGGIFVTEPGGGYEEFFMIQTPNNDSYRILIDLQPGAQPNDTYKIEVIGTDVDGTVNVDFLVENALISDIPKNGYTFSANHAINADFTNEMLNINSVKFFDASTGNITSRLWSFGDDTFAENVTEVTHTYTAPGNYTVTLTVSGPDGEDSAYQIVNVLSTLLPPASVTNLYNTTNQQTSIMWAWTDPTSVDMDHVMVYLDGVFQQNVTQGVQAFTATGLSPSTAYTVGTRTVGTTGLINETWVNHTAMTAPSPPTPVPPASVTNLHNTTHQQTSITWAWTDPTSVDFDHIMVYLDGVFQNNVTQGVQSFTSTALSPATSYTIGIRTVGTTGLVNLTWVNHSATTAPEPVFVPAPIASFIANQTSGMTPFSVQFVDTSTSDSITTRIWSFGDGETSTDMNPLHIYTTPGTYTVSLQVTNGGGSNTSTKANYINATQSLPLVPDFEGTPLVGNAPFEVVFTDTSSGIISSRLWNFGDGTTVWKNETNTVSHTYSFPGTYTISLTSGNEEGQETVTKTEYIQVNPTGTAPVARFIAVPMIGYEQRAVRFSDRSTGTPLTWQWDFGDGSSSSEQNPSHAYTTSGRFVVTLTVFNNGGSSSYSSTVWMRPAKLSFPTYNSTSHVIVKPPILHNLGYSPISFFTMDKTFGSSPMTVQFTDMSFRSPSSWEWDFDDGETSTLQNPIHTYNIPGTYSVSLTVKNSIGESTTSRRVYVR